ncbi:mechanosensitive ion channel family protein [Longimicrobium terrae]|uniref:Small conductance mechanosensitive channel n=1 Tax=Longimicrobium terrae TaxID=1639882 RepID=A0A841GUL1_9BACT|nr:mechanosensitive ion channel family protein [Longimicrobium terrae]MBB4634407.1 small conductance mechanosensitive channel [Longimicrobium terrae]MBB6068703.1 small conductance mechanosensitive channel [Longimicrobium terrae]NNC27889.1 mechanosensitive ion channel family protein [Longimicrobium terrae]
MIQADTLTLVQLAQLRDKWTDKFTWEALAITGLRVAGALFVTLLLYWALRLVLRRVERALGDPTPGVLSAQTQRARTLLSLLRSMGMVLVAILGVFMVLGSLGVNLGPLLAGAGVLGLAVSFGAQSLVKDIISGLFILFENQFGVGDVIRIEGVSGTVEKMTLRVVVLRDVHGVLHIVPNGEIKKVSNLTRTWARVVLDVGVGYREDPDRVIGVLRDLGRELYEDPQWKPLLLDPVEVPGIEAFGESAITVRVMAKTLPLKQWDVARELRRRIKYRFDREEIEIPFPHQTVTWAEPPVVSAVVPAGGGDHAADGVPGART